MNCRGCGNWIGNNEVFKIRSMRYCADCRVKMVAPGRPANSERPLCHHCRKRVMCRPKGLCWPCYYDLEIRKATVSTSKHAYRSPFSLHESQLKMPKPTRCFPGTKEKTAVVAERAAAGERLWHPLDAMTEDSSDRRGAFLEGVG